MSTTQFADGGEASARGRSREPLPRAPTRTLRIIELVLESEGGVTLADVSTQLAIPRTSAFNLLEPLVTLSYIVYDSGRYRVGPLTFR